MSTQPAGASAPGIVLPAFEDGLGRRYRPTSKATDTPPEILCFRHELTDVPSFEFSLRERVGRLQDFQHPYYARIRKVDRLSDERGTVALMSDCAPGTRLIEILTTIQNGGPVLGLDAALSLIRQLAPAMALLHDQARVGHGAIAPERLIVTPRSRLFIVEHVVGAALEQLRYSRERYWRELRVALPMSVGLARFDERADLTQLGVVALSLILGRPLHDDEYPSQVDDLVASANSRATDGSTEPLPNDLREWLRRTLQLDVRHSYRSLNEAGAALDQLLDQEGAYQPDVNELEHFLANYYALPASIPGASKPGPVAEIPRPQPKPEMPQAKSEQPRFEIPPAPKFDLPSVAVEMPARDRGISKFESETGRETVGSGADHDEVDFDEWQPVIPLPRKKSTFAKYQWAVAGVAGLLMLGGGAYAARGLFSSPAPVPTTGTISIDTNPPGGKVEVDGSEKGVSPVTLTLPEGAHTLSVRGNGEPRVMQITIKAGTQVSQYLELPAAVAANGQVQIRTEPNGAHISVDGIPRGTTPLTVVDLAPGDHVVKVESDLGTVNQHVTIEPGATASLVVPLGAAQTVAPASGWVSVQAPFAMDLYEQGHMLGNSGIDRIMLSPGRHDIEIVNEPVGYREVRTVQISPNRVSTLSVTLPKGNLSLNAVPWASVTIDGESVGETPIGNLSLTVGPHEVVFRNPQLGEQRRVITVSQRAPVRFSIDMNQK